MPSGQRVARIAILGSTGSVGASTLEVVARHPSRFEVFALTASTQTETMLAQCVQFKPSYAVMASAPHGRALADQCRAAGLDTQVLIGPENIGRVTHRRCSSMASGKVGNNASNRSSTPP